MYLWTVSLTLKSITLQKKTTSSNLKFSTQDQDSSGSIRYTHSNHHQVAEDSFVSALRSTTVFTSPQYPGLSPPQVNEANVKKPRVRCSTLAVAEAVSRKVDFAKTLLLDQRETLLWRHNRVFDNVK